MFFKITDQRDADGVFVPVVLGVAFDPAVGAFSLDGPAPTDFGFSVGGAAAVVYDEVVAHAVPAAFLVQFVDQAGRAFFGDGVMNENAAPASGKFATGERNPVCRCVLVDDGLGGGRLGGGATGRWDGSGGAGPDLRQRQAVGAVGRAATDDEGNDDGGDGG